MCSFLMKLLCWYASIKARKQFNLHDNCRFHFVPPQLPFQLVLLKIHGDYARTSGHKRFPFNSTANALAAYLRLGNTTTTIVVVVAGTFNQIEHAVE